MRVLIFLAISLCISRLSTAQVNRSANQFAREKVRDYITTKLFRHQSYKEISYGDLQPYETPRNKIAWTLEHRFIIAGYHQAVDMPSTDTASFRFLFYLDDKMKIIKAFSYQQK